MKNNRRVKMIAWIMTAVMLLCTMPVAAMATEGAADTFSLSNIKTGKFILNNNATCDVFYTKDNQTYDDLSNAVLNQDYVMEIKVSRKEDIPIPDKTMYYELPSDIFSAVAGSNLDVSWKKEGKYLVFNWVKGTKDGFTADVTVRACKEYDLYNIAKIDGAYYRLKKTKITVSKSLDDYIAGKQQGKDNPVPNNEYSAEEYEFGDITIDGILYEYRPNDFQPALNDTLCYYKVKYLNVTAVKGKIGGMINSSTPRWINGIKLYDDRNETDSFHRNYELTLYRPEGAYEQPLYNFIGRKDTNNSLYYRLKKTKIIAQNPKTIGDTKVLTEGSYTLIPDEDYDFTNVVLIIKGVDYKYSPVVPDETEIHDNVFTVELERIYSRNRMHSKTDWYTNEAGWLDDSKSTFTEFELANNQTWGIHRDYTYTLYPANASFYNVEMHDGEDVVTIRRSDRDETELTVPEKDGFTFVGWAYEDGSTFEPTVKLTHDIVIYAQWNEAVEKTVQVESDWPEGKLGYVGAKITLSAVLNGYDGLTMGTDYKLQWQYKTTDSDWIDIAGAEGEQYIFILDEINTFYTWRVIGIDLR